jgi:hypothetical protein
VSAKNSAAASSVHERELSGNKTPADRPYRFAPFLYAARTLDGVVLLDLKGNRYLGITAGDDALLSLVVRNWPASPNEQISESHREYSAAERLAVACATSGLLVEFSELRDPFPSIPTSLNQDLVSIGDELRPRVSITIGHVFNFLAAYVVAACSLRWRELLRIAQDVRAARDANRRARFDCETASRYVAAFRRIRPYFFRSRGQCLLHSLTLTFFLQRYGVPATWVIGVKTGPWEAHSWVQEGPYLLDTNPEKVCEFTPILGI